MNQAHSAFGEVLEERLPYCRISVAIASATLTDQTDEWCQGIVCAGLGICSLDGAAARGKDRCGVSQLAGPFKFGWNLPIQNIARRGTRAVQGGWVPLAFVWCDAYLTLE